MAYNWYERINNSEDLRQGDLIPNCPIIIPPSTIEENDENQFDVELMDVVILSQSCDLAQNKLEVVVVAWYYTLTEFIENLPEDEKQSKKARNKKREELRKGHLPAFHLLNKDPNYFNDYLVVDFHYVFGIHINTLKNIAKKLKERNKLMPPYRERLSQAFAKYIMRVGLPQDIKIELE